MSVYINGYGSVSALGSTSIEVRQSYQQNSPEIMNAEVGNNSLPIYIVAPKAKLRLFSASALNESADRVHRLALHAAFNALESSGWLEDSTDTAVIIGSARGATSTIEGAIRDFILSDETKVRPWTSPLTTAGNIAAFISKEFSLGTSISTSMTCASALESFITAKSFIESGFSKRCLAGGAEAPLTPFGLAQMQALRIYSNETDSYPCKPCGTEKISKNALALGEGAAVFSLSSEQNSSTRAEIVCINSLVESIDSPTGMDSSGASFVEVMKKNLEKAKLDSVDAVILHAPGTALGDMAEVNAIHQLFGDTLPALYTTKHLTGHTFGASGALSLELALLLLEGFRPSSLPFASSIRSNTQNRTFSSVLVNCAGFGGVVGSILIRKV